MMRGMPGGMHIQDVSQPKPPAFCSAVVLAKIAAYSALSGATSPPWTQRGGPTRSHLPFQSGYFDSSNARAPVVAPHRAVRATAQTSFRYDMDLLPARGEGAKTRPAGAH